ncbi:hypothetical protein HNQ07_001396 [Deinococcus metalli]|nr:O-antigen ligase family protein [Deinococcus metalli]MBB5375939.1 hypothetical protein [Deinococcus metalli]
MKTYPTARPQPGMLYWHAALVLAAGTGVGLLYTVRPTYAVGLGVLLLLMAILGRIWANVQLYALGLIGISLAGYAFLGKGYAYVGVPPLFIGEVTLVLGLLATLKSVAEGVRLTRVGGLLLALGVFMAISLSSTLPYIGRYGLDSLRDAATWYYALFAVVVPILIVRFRALGAAIRRYGQILPCFLLLAPIVFWISRLLLTSLPKWPISGQAIVEVKGGDLAVQLAGIMVFLLLGLQRVRATPTEPAVGRRMLDGSSPWWWWVLWMVSSVGLFTGRAALISIAVPLLLVLVVRPLSRWGRPLLVVVSLFSLLLVVNPRYETSTGRELSIDGLLLNIQSIGGGTGDSAVDGTRTWRLDWWHKIEEYTIGGDYFWTGKGYGINLANADGFQVQSDQSLRNPHSIHFSILARSGVPGLVSWAVLNIVFAGSLLLAFVRARVRGHLMWANVHLWLLAYWLAFIINGSFDVFIEGPQGGIWFWSVMGFGIAALELYRRGEEL